MWVLPGKLHLSQLNCSGSYSNLENKVDVSAKQFIHAAGQFIIRIINLVEVYWDKEATI